MMTKIVDDRETMRWQSPVSEFRLNLVEKQKLGSCLVNIYYTLVFLHFRSNLAVSLLFCSREKKRGGVAKRNRILILHRESIRVFVSSSICPQHC